MADDRMLTATLTPGNLLERLQVVDVNAKDTALVVAQDYQHRRLGFHGVVQRDPQYTLTLEFSSDDGGSFANPAVNVPANRIMQLKCIIEQHQAEPLVRGFQTYWTLPSGWTFRDGLSRRLWDEAVSNPLIVTRTVLSPANPQRAPVVVVVERLFI